MMKRADYAVITVCLDKVSFYYHHPKATLDVYETLIQNALERYFYFLKARSAVGDVFVEAQNPGTDEIIKNRYRKAVADGTEFISGPKLQSVLTSREVNIAPKRRGLPGLQMADLLARPAFAHCRAVYTGDSGDLKGFAAEVAPILEALKFYRDSSGNPDRYGRCWRPALKR